jgi:hypothetical protein
MKRLDTLRNWLADRIRATDTRGEATNVTPEVDRDVHTLDHWRRIFSTFPRTIECPAMELKVGDFDPPVFTGPGRIEIKSAADIRFYIHGEAANIKRAIYAMRAARENPFDALAQFRLFATDYRNNEWACGATEIDFYVDHDRGWPLSGTLEQISTVATGPWVCGRSGVELLIVPPISLPVSESLTQIVRIGPDTVQTVRGPGRHTLDILGSTIRFSYEASGEALWITADTSEKLQHPYLDGWLVEPLRILLGGSVAPRMIARNRGDGTAQVTLLAGHPFKEPTPVGLHPPFVAHENRFESFWRLYADILTLLADAKIWGPHSLTSYFDEIAQAMRGTRWVLTMTLANTVEALASALITDADKRSEFDEETLGSLDAHIRAWDKDAALRGRMLNSLGMIRRRSVLRFLRDLAARGEVEADQVQAWTDVRNAVMHGNLVSPWSTEDGEARLNAMLKLVHGLALIRIRRG